MNLGLISDCLHFRDKSGRIGSYVHIFVRQIDFLSESFDKTIICAPVISDAECKYELTYYQNINISFIELPSVGGPNFRDKLKLLATIPTWISSFIKISSQVDILYQRFPNNLNIPGFFYSHLFRIKKFATYTGVWESFKGEEPTIWFQRMLLKYFFSGPVFVYSSLDNIKTKRLFSTTSPSYSLSDWISEENTFLQKIYRIDNYQSSDKVILINVASLVPHKNQLFLLKSILLLRDKINFHLYIVGQGREFNNLQKFIVSNKLSEFVTLTGQITQIELRKLFRLSDFVIQPPLWEGYGKVPIEGLFHSVIPVLSNVNMHPFFTGEDESRGSLFNLDNPENIVNSITRFTSDKVSWRNAIRKGREFSVSFTLEEWRNSLISNIESYHKIKITKQ